MPCLTSETEHMAQAFLSHSLAAQALKSLQLAASCAFAASGGFPSLQQWTHAVLCRFR